ncbi:MAG: hypothetical protein CMJ24_02035 [Phycisphaerae bacterium]|nr:hypothetical protein [Phycisphaerae bacterium]MAB82199.1 hypothetical protein [Phycisphaerae bacterium]|tara:strand:- start:3468 stop:4682 length:1215 start_codon:yes stop_codon:yes gene_type:complete
MNLPLNILGQDETGSASPCRFEPATATMLLAPVPGTDVPDMESILQSVSNYSGMELGVRVAPEGGTHAEWACQIELDGLPFPIAIWCDRSEEVEEATLEITGEQCTWVLGIESVLSHEDPLTNYVNLVRLVAGSLSDTPVLHDAGSGHWLERDQIEKNFMQHELEPPEDILWRIEAHDRGDDTFDVMTGGLERCGRAELVMHGVPESHRPVAIEVIGDLAALSLELAFPGIDGRIEIGPGLQVSFDPHQSEDDEEPVYAVVLDADDHDSEYPRQVLSSVGDGDVAVYRTIRHTRRNTARAQATWKLFLDACRGASDNESIDCLVQVPFEQVEADDDRREHLWLQVVSISEDSVEAKLVHTPRLVTGIDIGWLTTIEAEEVSGWMIRTPDGLVGPSDVDMEEEEQ